MTGEEAAAPAGVPLRGRRLSWRLPGALALAGFVVKVVVSVLVDDTVGTWAGGALGFASVVAGGLLAWQARRDGDGDPARDSHRIPR